MRIRFVLASSGLSVLAVVLSTNAYPDTRNSDRDPTTMERKASPSTAGNTHKAKPGTAASKKKGQKESASTGSSAPSSSDAAKAERDKAFKVLDLDGDGQVSKAEAAGNATLITRVDRADRNRDGKLSRKEYDALAKMKK